VLRELRAEAGLSQEELAARANIHRTYVSFLERGLKNPSVGKLIAISRAVGVTGAEFVRRVEELLTRKRRASSP